MARHRAWAMLVASRWLQAWTQTYHVSLIYGKGEAAGYYGLDTACLNSDPQLCVERRKLFSQLGSSVEGSPSCWRRS